MKNTKFWKLITNIKVISGLIVLLAVGMAALGVHQAREYESSILAIYVEQQDAYVQLVLDQINVLENRSDEEIVKKILGSLDTSGRKYWTLTKDQALLFVKDVTETNRYKGLATENFFTSRSAGIFLNSLTVNRVVHSMITMDEERYVASGVIFEYNSAEYKICLLTNDTVILDNNVFLSSKIGLYVFGMILLGMLLLVSMIFANVLDLRDKKIRSLQEHIMGLNKVLEEQTETIREMDCYHTRWSVFRLPMLKLFVEKLAQRRVLPVTFASVIFTDKDRRDRFLQRAQILLDEKVLRFENQKEEGKGLILVFIHYSEEETQRAMQSFRGKDDDFQIEQMQECTENGTSLAEAYDRFMKNQPENRPAKEPSSAASAHRYTRTGHKEGTSPPDRSHDTTHLPCIYDTWYLFL